MVISINEASEVPIYQQIRNQIVLGISDGRLKPGEQLPTVRALAGEIGINSMTVNKAYALLKQEGYIYRPAEWSPCAERIFRSKGIIGEIPRTIAADYFRSQNLWYDTGRILKDM